MALLNVTRSSDSPWIDSVWRSSSDDDDTEMTSVASETWGLAFWTQDGSSFAAVTGPESRAASAPVPQSAEFVGIQFAVGTSLRMVGTSALVDSGIELPDTHALTFRLDGARWEIPRMDDAEALVARLVREEVIVRDPVVAATLEGRRAAISDRTVERRFRSATGFTRGTIDQIRRARAAAELLSAGASVSAAIASSGYYDEPHLARALRRYVGRTAGQLRGGGGGAIALARSADDVVDGLHDAVGVRG